MNAAKTKRNTLGASRPKNEGPRRMPAIISPTTAGCPQRTKIQPTTPEAPMMTKSCKKSRLSGLAPFWRKLDSTEATNEELLASVTCRVACAAASGEIEEIGGGR